MRSASQSIVFVINSLTAGGAERAGITDQRRTLPGRLIDGLGDLEAAPHQKSLEPVRTGPGVADEEDSMIGLFRQLSLPRDEACQAIVHPMGRQPQSAVGAPGA